MKLWILRTTDIAALAFILFSCTPEIISSPKSAPITPAEIASPEAVTGTAWEKEWLDTKNQAKKEGRLMGYSSLGPEVRIALSDRFKKVFGIDIDWVAGSTATLPEKVLTERRNGLYLADFYVGGGDAPLLALKPQGALDQIEPMIISEIVELDKWPDGKLPFLDKTHKILSFVNMVAAPVLINTNIVGKGELKHYNDFLDTKWKGKIVIMDPSISGSGSTWFYVQAVYLLGLDYMRELVKQQPLIIRDQRLQAEWIAQGKYAIGVAPKISVVVEFLAAGAPLAEINVDPEYTTSSGGNLSLINRSPHPSATKLFINWLLTKEGQTLFTRSNNSPSRRSDVSLEGLALSPARVIKPGKQYFQSDNEEVKLSVAEKGYPLAREIFAPLLK